MEIFLSNKLSEIVPANKITSNQSINEKWSAHLFVTKRKKNIVITHKETLYSFFVLDFRKSDLKNLPQIILDQLLIQLEVNGIQIPLALSYFKISNDPQLFFLKTDNDQKTLGWIKDLIQVNQLFINDSNQDTIITSAFFAHNNMNDRLVGVRKFKSPIQMLQEKLAILQEG